MPRVFLPFPEWDYKVVNNITDTIGIMESWNDGIVGTFVFHLVKK